MSAADKLRALEAATVFDPIMGDEEDAARIEQLGDALPALIAVVEAAEDAIAPYGVALKAIGCHNEDPEWLEWRKFSAAVVALDHALGSDRPKPGYDKPMFGGS